MYRIDDDNHINLVITQNVIFKLYETHTHIVYLTYEDASHTETILIYEKATSSIIHMMSQAVNHIKKDITRSLVEFYENLVE